MRHAGRCRVLENVPGGGREEVHDGLLLERRRVRDVDDDRCALEHVSQSLSGESVDSGVWRGRHDLMTMFTQLRDEFRTDQSGAADDDEFHSQVPSSVEAVAATDSVVSVAGMSEV